VAPDVTSEKSLPHNLEAERSVLGAILVDNGALHLAQQSLKAEDFYREAHRQAYAACERLAQRGMAIDIVTARDELERAGELESSGGAAYVAALVDGVPRTAHIEHYVRIVKDRALARRLIRVAGEILRKAYAASEESDVLLDEAERMVFAVGQERLRSGFLPASAIAEATYRQVEELSRRNQLITGIETGFSQLDEMTSGLQKGELIIVAARPSMGKTAFCLNIAQHAAVLRGAKVGIFSLEMSREQLFTRMVSALGRIDGHAMRRGMLNKKAWTDLGLAFETLAHTQIWIDDTPGTGITEMRAKVMRLKAEHGLDIVFVDYLQLMSGRGRYESRQQEISDISRSLKEMAKELSVPVVAASQLSRAPEQRAGGDRRPQLSDLRESGAIEQDADVVMFIYRPELYGETADNKGIAEILVRKQRNGPTGDVQLIFLKNFTLFANPEFRSE